MENILNIVAKIIEFAANFASESTSMIISYQPEKPEFMKKADEE